jgi:hypothetical protein
MILNVCAAQRRLELGGSTPPSPITCTRSPSAATAWRTRDRRPPSFASRCRPAASYAPLPRTRVIEAQSEPARAYERAVRSPSSECPQAETPGCCSSLHNKMDHHAMRRLFTSALIEEHVGCVGDDLRLADLAHSRIIIAVPAQQPREMRQLHSTRALHHLPSLRLSAYVM